MSRVRKIRRSRQGARRFRLTVSRLRAWRASLLLLVCSVALWGPLVSAGGDVPALWNRLVESVKRENESILRDNENMRALNESLVRDRPGQVLSLSRREMYARAIAEREMQMRENREQVELLKKMCRSEFGE